eukprot:2355890-Rhodomonas_salina.1
MYCVSTLAKDAIPNARRTAVPNMRRIQYQTCTSCSTGVLGGVVPQTEADPQYFLGGRGWPLGSGSTVDQLSTGQSIASVYGSTASIA